MKVPLPFWQVDGLIPISKQESQKAGVQNNVASARPKKNEEEEQGLLFLTFFLGHRHFFIPVIQGFFGKEQTGGEILA